MAKRKCIGCNHYISNGREVSAKDRVHNIGRCDKYMVTVIDSLCGCREEEGKTILMNFDADEVRRVNEAFKK